MKILRSVLSIGIAATVGFAGLHAASPETEDSRNQMLQHVRAAEIRGDSVLRRQLLAAVLRESPDSREAHWLRGEIEHNGAWVRYSDAVDQWNADRTLDEYRAVREQHAMTSADQLELANWCRSHRLLDREQAHLTAALELSKNPNNPALRSRLGYRQINGEWRTQAELEGLKQSRLDFQNDVKTWKPRIQKLAKMLSSPRSEFRQQAAAELKAIQDPGALPALEIVLGNTNLEAGQLLAQILGEFPGHQAADSLARLAVLSPWEPVRQEAIRHLRSRPFGTYVPELLSTLRTPLAARIQLLIGSGGVHLLEQFSSETQLSRQVLDKRSSKYIVTRSNSQVQSITGPERDRNRVQRATASAALEAKLQAIESQNAADLRKEKTENWNQRVCEVLKGSTGFQLGPDPEQWWGWWADYNQMTEEEKEYEYCRYEDIELEVVEVQLPTVAPMVVAPTTVARPAECLVAGTLIWTDRGAVAVEAVEVGDLVLSKDAETGELAYQPVLRTTVREAEPIMKVTTEHGETRATGGHTFWISGQGWTKLRDVKPGQVFHGANGPVRIQSLKDDGTEKTFNLLVANVHTYFVGRELILSHDVTLAEPSDAVVPGDRK